MSSRRWFVVLFVFVGNCVLLFLWIDRTFVSPPLLVASAQLATPPPPGAEEATIAAEITAVARFTLEPEVAVSYTPYFVEIIARNLARQNLTATAIATHSPTPLQSATPTITPTGTPLCAPAIAVRLLDEEATVLNDQLIANGLEASSEVQVGYVDHIDGSCDVPALPFNTRLVINVDVADGLTMSREQRGDALAPVLAAVAAYDLPDELRERNIQLVIFLTHDEDRLFFQPRYDLALRAVEQNLTGVELIIYLTEPF